MSMPWTDVGILLLGGLVAVIGWRVLIWITLGVGSAFELLFERGGGYRLEEAVRGPSLVASFTHDFVWFSAGVIASAYGPEIRHFVDGAAHYVRASIG